MRHLPTLAALLTITAVLAARGQTPQTLPPFRASVEVVRLDVSVLDRDRQPVKGLTPGNFTIYEDGVPQPIIAFDAVDIPAPAEPTAPWMRDAGRDVVTNDANMRRIVVIVLDDAFLPIGDATAIAQHVARDVIDQLGDSDWAAVTHTGFGRRQDITQDRRRLRAAVDSLTPSGHVGCEYRGKFRSPAACAIDTLVTAADALKEAPPERKTLVFISSGPPLMFEARDLTSRGLGGDPYEALQYMLNALRQANVTVYAIDPSGLDSHRGFMGPEIDALRTLAEQTGGRTTMATNSPWKAVPQIFRENSSYYLLGFRSTNPKAGGTFRKIRVTVNRPDVEVRTRTGYHAPLAPNPTSSNSDAQAPRSPLDAALVPAVPGGELPLGITLAPFAIPGKRQAAVAIATELREPLLLASQTLELATMALDADCGDCRKLPSSTQTAMFTIPPGVEALQQAQVLSRLNLPPGSYEIRVAATLDGRAGGVFAHVDIPDYGKDKLSASGLVLSAPGEVSTAQQELMADVIPVVPTALRQFHPGAAVSAFLRIYQGSSNPPAAVRVTAKILDDANQTSFEQTTFLAGAYFGRLRSADYRLPLLLADLHAGPHLLVVEATLGHHSVRREARFRVK